MKSNRVFTGAAVAAGAIAAVWVLFVAERRVCDEDTDLGLEYTVGRMLASAALTPERR